MRPELVRLTSLPSVDVEYRFDRPHVYLSQRELARLTLLRSRLADTRAERAAERLPQRIPARPAAAAPGPAADLRAM